MQSIGLLTEGEVDHHLGEDDGAHAKPAMVSRVLRAIHMAYDITGSKHA